MKKVKFTCLLLAVISLIHVGCDDHKIEPIVPSDIPIPGDIKLQEDPLRLALNNSWSKCVAKGNSSTLLYIDMNTGLLLTTKGNIDLYAHEFVNNNCAGNNYQTYKVATYDYSDFKSTDKLNGTAKINLSVYYPNNLSVETGITRLSSGILADAEATFKLSNNNIDLALTLKNNKSTTIKAMKKITRGKTTSNDVILKRENNVIDLKLKKAVRVMTSIYGDIPSGSYSGSDVQTFRNQDEVLEWLKTYAPNTVPKVCLTKYLKIPEPFSYDNFDSFIVDFYKDQKSHVKLTELGYQPTQLQIFDIEDKYKNPHVVFVFYYDKKDDAKAEEVSSVACPIKGRARGLYFYN